MLASLAFILAYVARLLLLGSLTTQICSFAFAHANLVFVAANLHRFVSLTVLGQALEATYSV